jgi:hypothetical protein
MIDSNPQGFKQMIDSAVAQSPKAAEANKNAAQGALDSANATKINLENKFLQDNGGLTAGMAESKYLSLQQKVKQGIPIAPPDKAFIAAYEKNKSLNTVTQFNLQNGGATGAQGKPSSIAQGIADGSIKWTDAVSPRTPMNVKADLLAEVKGINPQFKSSDFEVEKKVQEKYTSGNVSDQLLAIGTAREHMKTFSTLADALDNGDIQAVNKIGNALGVQFGSDKATNLQIARGAFSGEVGRAFDGAGVTTGERQETGKSMGDQLSKGQFKGAINTVDALLAGKQKAAQDAYNQTKQGKPNFGQQQTAPQGGYTPPAGAKSAVGANGHKIVVDGGKWVDAVTGKPI